MSTSYSSSHKSYFSQWKITFWTQAAHLSGPWNLHWTMIMAETVNGKKMPHQKNDRGCKKNIVQKVEWHHSLASPPSFFLSHQEWWFWILKVIISSLGTQRWSTHFCQMLMCFELSYAILSLAITSLLRNGCTYSYFYVWEVSSWVDHLTAANLLKPTGSRAFFVQTNSCELANWLWLSNPN